MRPYLRVANVFEDRIDLSDVLQMNFTPQEFETYKLQHGDILLNEGQSLELVGRPAMYRDELPGSCFQNTLVRFRPSPAVISAFALLVFRHYLHSQRFQRIAKWTVNIAHLGATRFAELPLPVPPLGEQRRIVAKIEELFSDLNAGIAALERVRANLKRYRAAVLKAAVEGKLTEDWRAQHPDTEPASVLLERILTERRRQWEQAQLAKFVQSGKQPLKGWQERYPEPLTDRCAK
jgi:type I restriction enzyme S subunit